MSLLTVTPRMKMVIVSPCLYYIVCHKNGFLHAAVQFNNNLCRGTIQRWTFINTYKNALEFCDNNAFLSYIKFHTTILGVLFTMEGEQLGHYSDVISILKIKATVILCLISSMRSTEIRIFCSALMIMMYIYTHTKKIRTGNIGLCIAEPAFKDLSSNCLLLLSVISSGLAC